MREDWFAREVWELIRGSCAAAVGGGRGSEVGRPGRGRLSRCRENVRASSGLSAAVPPLDPWRGGGASCLFSRVHPHFSGVLPWKPGLQECPSPRPPGSPSGTGQGLRGCLGGLTVTVGPGLTRRCPSAAWVCVAQGPRRTIAWAPKSFRQHRTPAPRGEAKGTDTGSGSSCPRWDSHTRGLTPFCVLCSLGLASLRVVP